MTNPFKNVAIEPLREPKVKRRYSVTADVVGFRRCPRQYGAFRVQNYAPAHQTQLYFGTIIHQVLDRCHNHYRGDPDPSTKGFIPDNGRVLADDEIEAFFNEMRRAQRDGMSIPQAPSEIVRYFVEVENGLKSRGIWAISPEVRVKAIRVLQYFNALEGEELYARVKDTEHRLQADRGDHILNGVVDLLVDSPDTTDDPAECEIWDYKGTERIYLTPQDRRTYEFQMRVYAQLYQLKHGVRPKKAVLYFVNDLDGRTVPTERPKNALLSVSLDPGEITEAVNEFTKTVAEIEAARQDQKWPPANPGEISEQDCAICDLRWNCPTPNDGKGVALRYP